MLSGNERSPSGSSSSTASLKRISHSLGFSSSGAPSASQRERRIRRLTSRFAPHLPATFPRPANPRPCKNGSNTTRDTFQTRRRIARTRGAAGPRVAASPRQPVGPSLHPSSWPGAPRPAAWLRQSAMIRPFSQFVVLTRRFHRPTYSIDVSIVEEDSSASDAESWIIIHIFII